MMRLSLVCVSVLFVTRATAFTAPLSKTAITVDTPVLFASTTPRSSSSTTTTATSKSDELAEQKAKLFGLLGKSPPATKAVDPVLADPDTKEPIQISPKGTMFGGEKSGMKYEIKSSTNEYEGSSQTFINLLEPKKEPKEATTEDDTSSSSSSDTTSDIAGFVQRQLSPFVPPPLRTALSVAGVTLADDYIPMRDLFTSPSVSFAYERGWRQGFAQAGFPGADAEFEMAREYFAPSVTDGSSVVVDMSCATGECSD